MDLEVAPGERRLDEGADRAPADLTRAEDVERAHGHRGQPVLGGVGVRHVLAGELRHGVGPPCLADRADRRHVPFLDVERVLPEHLAGRELDEPLEGAQRRERRLERVVRADDVHAHRPDGAGEHGVDAGDPRRVDDVRAARGELREPLRVEHVSLDEAEVRMLGQLGSRERVAVEVVHGDDLVGVDEPRGERRADEPRPAGDEHPLSRQRHGRIVDAGAVARPSFAGAASARSRFPEDVQFGHAPFGC